MPVSTVLTGHLCSAVRHSLRGSLCYIPTATDSWGFGTERHQPVSGVHSGDIRHLLKNRYGIDLDANERT